MDKNIKILILILSLTLILAIGIIITVFFLFYKKQSSSTLDINKYYYDNNTKTCIGPDVIGDFNTKEECIEKNKDKMISTPEPTTTPKPTITPSTVFKYGCNENGECVKMSDGIYDTSNCLNQCTDKRIRNRLDSGQSIQDNTYIQSPDYNCRLIMKDTGVAVVTRRPFLSETRFPNSNINAGDSGKLLMTSEGDFVMQKENSEIVWSALKSINSKVSPLDTGNYVVTLIKSNGFCSDTQKLDIKIVLPTELLEVNKNPIVGKDYIEIYEPSGKIVYSGILTNLIIVPSNFGLTSGYYIVCIKNNYTIKIIKQINVSK